MTIRRNRPKPLQVVPEQVPDFPPPREEWLPETIESWDRFSRSQMASVLDLGADGMALYRLFDLYDEGRRIRQVTWAEPLVEGSRGQPMLHPLLRRLSGIESQMLALEDRFGMNPKARLALGIAVNAPEWSLEALNARFGAD